MKDQQVLDASFRDPAGFLFRKDGVLLRQINRSYQNEYEWCRTSGLFEDLMSRELLIAHEEVVDSSTGLYNAPRTYGVELGFAF